MCVFCAAVAGGAVTVACVGDSSVGPSPADDAGADAGTPSNDASSADGSTPQDSASPQMDAGAADATDAAQCDLLAAFGAPVAITDLDASVGLARFTADELDMYFDSMMGGGKGDFDIWTASRAMVTAPFGAATDIAEVNTGGVEREPSVNGAATVMYAATGTVGAFDIIVSTRATKNDPWGAFVPAAGLNGTGSDHEPYTLVDHSAVYFTSDRSGNVDLFMAARSGGGFQTAVPVPGVNSTAVEATAVVTSDELTIFFASNRAPKSGTDFDIYIAQRASTADPFGTAVPLDTLNGSGADYPTWTSPDGCTLYYTHGGGSAPLYRTHRGD
jgi:hypothetical protein